MGSYRAYDSYVASNMSEDDLLLAENVEAVSIGEVNELYTQVFKNWHKIYFIETDSVSIPTDSVYGECSARIGKTYKQLDDLYKAGYKWDRSHIHGACKCKYNETVDDDHKIPVIG